MWMWRKKLIITLTTVALFAVASSINVEGGDYQYLFNIEPSGEAKVTITFESRSSGSSWILVPKNFTRWIKVGVQGEIVSSSLKEAQQAHVFYQNLSFTYRAVEGGFKLNVLYNLSYAALIEEPLGLFYSSMMSYSPRDSSKATVLLPPGSSSEVRVYGSIRGYRVVERAGIVGVEALGPFDGGRLAIEFIIPDRQAEVVTITGGLFEVKAASRYESLARRVLSLYEEAYPLMKDLVGVELDKVGVRLYVPRMGKLGVGGYIPFMGGRLGEININIFFIRAVKDTIDLIALHELAHHFIWRAGLEPRRLWAHEGLAEYLSIELGGELGLGVGVEERKNNFLSLARNFISLGFVQEWSLDQTGPLLNYYAASYYIFKTLGDRYGGREFYRSFFEYVRSLGRVSEDVVIVNCLSLAAGQDLYGEFRAWGFNLPFVSLREEMVVLEASLKKLPAWLQPARMLATVFLEDSRRLNDVGAQGLARICLDIAKIILNNAVAISIAIYLLLALALILSIKSIKLKAG